MIAMVQGRVLEKTLQTVIVDAGGVGYEVHCPTSVLADIGGVGEQVLLRTHLDVREDLLQLYGFADKEQLELFRMLISVAGVGPKIAVALLSSYGPGELVAAITARDLKKVTAVSGLGKKIAQRIFLELGERLAGLGGIEGAATMGGFSAPVAGEGPWQLAAAALSQMGFKPFEVSEALATAKVSLGDEASEEAILQVAFRSRGARPASPMAFLGAAGEGKPGRGGKKKRRKVKTKEKG